MAASGTEIRAASRSLQIRRRLRLIAAPEILFAIVVALRIFDALLGRISQPDEPHNEGRDGSNQEVELIRRFQLPG